MQPSKCFPLIALSLFTLLTAQGCMLFRPGKNANDSNLLPKGTGNSFTIFIKGTKPETHEITEGMTLQSVLESSGSKRRFGKMDIMLKRMIPGKQVRHTINIDYDSKKKRVPFDQDYTIHPNDIVMIAPDNSTQLDKMVDALSGVFGK